MSLYSEKVMELFKNPHNMGSMEDADAVGQVGNPVCGDVMKIFLKVEGNVITDITFETFGCVSAIANSSMLTDLAKGKTLEEAEKITKQDIVEALGGLPPIKIHCSILAIEGLHEAIKQYRAKH